MTYRELLNELNELTDEQLDMDVTVCHNSMDEFYSCTSFNFADEEENDVLDKDHPYFVF